MDLFTQLFEAQISFGEHQHILWREVLGNLFGLASALGGMRRRVWAWPVGIVGNVLLFTVFMGAWFDTPQSDNLLGQAGRQIMFITVSVWGWRRWAATRRDAGPGGEGAAVVPRWATWRERAGIVVAAVVGVAVLTPVFRALGSFEPVWADAWIFTGSLLATYGMARGWVDFWLIWIAVDIVGVPLLIRAELYPSAFLYLFYGAFCVLGFVVWARSRTTRPQRPDTPAIETVG
jgi:nicotinamide mononucleotide transporter